MASTSATVEQRNQDATLYVGGLDDAADEELIWELFVQAGPVVSVHMPKDKVSGRHQNYAFVEFRGEEDADYAVKVLNMTRLFGKLIRVNKASSEKGKAVEGVGANLFIGNLDPEVDEKMLYDTFSAFGAIPMPPKVMRDPATGASKGFGFVSYDSFEAADTAIECMHGQFLCNRQVVVQYAFKKDSKHERHGTAAERLLAAAARAKRTAVAQLRPNVLFAAAPGQVVSAVPAGAGGGHIGAAGAAAPPPMLPPAAILPSTLGAAPAYPPLPASSSAFAAGSGAPPLRSESGRQPAGSPVPPTGPGPAFGGGPGVPGAGPGAGMHAPPPLPGPGYGGAGPSYGGPMPPPLPGPYGMPFGGGFGGMMPPPMPMPFYGGGGPGGMMPPPFPGGFPGMMMPPPLPYGQMPPGMHHHMPPPLPGHMQQR